MDIKLPLATMLELDVKHHIAMLHVSNNKHIRGTHNYEVTDIQETVRAFQNLVPMQLAHGARKTKRAIMKATR
jgi:2-iminoacetate synthase ThiH